MKQMTMKSPGIRNQLPPLPQNRKNRRNDAFIEFGLMILAAGLGFAWYMM